MPTTVTLVPDHALVLAGVAAICMSNHIIGGRLGPARSKYGVKYPNLYATPGLYLDKDGKIDQKAWEEKGTEFNKIQRGHQHMFELQADALAMLITCGVFYPRFAAQCAALFVAGTVVYALGYAIKPSYRFAGETLYIPGLLGWFYGIYCAGNAIWNDKPL